MGKWQRQALSHENVCESCQVRKNMKKSEKRPENKQNPVFTNYVVKTCFENLSVDYFISHFVIKFHKINGSSAHVIQVHAEGSVEISGERQAISIVGATTHVCVFSFFFLFFLFPFFNMCVIFFTCVAFYFIFIGS